MNHINRDVFIEIIVKQILIPIVSDSDRLEKYLQTIEKHFRVLASLAVGSILIFEFLCIQYFAEEQGITPPLWAGFGLPASVVAITFSGIATVYYGLPMWVYRPPSLNPNLPTITLGLIGRGGSGKTTFIKVAFTAAPLEGTQTLTDSFCLYDDLPIVVPKGKNLEKMRVRVADYEGQSLTQICADSDDVTRFIAPNGKVAVNALLFVVDIIPRVVENDKPVNDEDLWSWLTMQKDTPIDEIISGRVREHTQYINEGTLQFVHKKFNSENLRTVKLLINKIDIVRKLVEEGYLKRVDISQIDSYVMQEIDEVRRAIKAAWKDKFNEDTDIHVLSLRSADQVRVVINQITAP